MDFAAEDRSTDEDLIAAARAGDADAFGRLAARHRHLLTAYYRRQLWDAEAAEDGAQDVLLKVFRFLSRYESRARFTTFLFSVARNHGIDRLRSKRAMPHTGSIDESDSMIEGLEGAGPGPVESASANESEARLREAIAALPEAQRVVIRLAALEGLAHRRIAQRLSIPVGTVKSRIHTALGRVRAILQDRREAS
ncbi:MAG TPA: sigma-70 family RNA polymerase sigma factor [Planctomycetota bacterium]|nr:sigma-70 family RNA polymerase sigma factor [Planctomycetota bacterium]